MTTHPDVNTVRAARLAAGLTQQQLAAEAAVSLSYLMNLERGYTPTRVAPARDRVVAALAAYGFPLAEPEEAQ